MCLYNLIKPLSLSIYIYIYIYIYTQFWLKNKDTFSLYILLGPFQVSCQMIYLFEDNFLVCYVHYGLQFRVLTFYFIFVNCFFFQPNTENFGCQYRRKISGVSILENV